MEHAIATIADVVASEFDAIDALTATGFDARDIDRLIIYRDAVRAGFYSDELS